MNTMKHDDTGAINRYRCQSCGRRWANDVPAGFEDACPTCHAVTKPLGHGMTIRQFTAYWTVVFVAGWGFGFAVGLGAGSDMWWWPLW